MFFQSLGGEGLGFGYLGEGGVGLLISNGLLKQHETRDRKAASRPDTYLAYH